MRKRGKFRSQEARRFGPTSVERLDLNALQMDLSKYDFSSLRYLTNTAAALPVEHIRRLRQLLPHVTFFSMYGLTPWGFAEYTRVVANVFTPLALG